jgi:hypothetical protein
LADKKPSLIEYAGISGGRDYTRGFVNAIHKYLPTQDSLLNLKSGGDLELYEQVSQDDQVKSCLQQRFRAVTAKDWEVLPGGDKRIDKQAAEHLQKQLESIRWDDISEKMLWGVFYGYSAAEVLWAREDDRVVISAIKVRARRRFHFNLDQQLVLKTFDNPLGEDLPERKFWHFSTGADHDDEPYGRGLGHWLYWPTFFKRNGVRWWLKFIEKYAKPTRLGKYPAGATSAEKDVLWNALDSFGDDDRSMIPEGLEMLFLESARSGTVDYKALCDQMDGAIAKIILSQTMTTDDGSSLSQASVHESVKDEVIESDADLLCESFNNSVAVWLTDWNYPGAAYPKVRRKIQSDPDLGVLAETDTKLQGLGISLKPEAIATKYGDDYFTIDKNASPQMTEGQVNSLSSIVTSAKQGGWTPELLEGIINVSFPGLSEEAVAAITENLGDPAAAPGQVPDPNSQSPTPDPQTPEPATQSLDDVAAQFAEDEDIEAIYEFKMEEGAVKEKNGVKYILTNSRWKRAEPKPKAASKKKTLSEKAVAVVVEVKAKSGVAKVKKPPAEKKPTAVIKPQETLGAFQEIEKAEVTNQIKKWEKHRKIAENLAKQVELISAIDFYKQQPQDKDTKLFIKEAEKELAFKQKQTTLKPDPSAHARYLDSSNVAETMIKYGATGGVMRDGELLAAYDHTVRSDAVYVYTLAANPRTITEPGFKSGGAGTQAIKQLIGLSIEAGLKGKIALQPVDAAKGFYTKMGFKPSKDKPDEWHLSPTAAKKLIKGDK